jgi:hypothetical protein
MTVHERCAVHKALAGSPGATYNQTSVVWWGYVSKQQFLETYTAYFR